MVFPHEMWQKLGDMGMLGLTVEEEYGGMGLGYFEHCMAVEEISKANSAPVHCRESSVIASFSFGF